MPRWYWHRVSADRRAHPARSPGAVLLASALLAVGVGGCGGTPAAVSGGPPSGAAGSVAPAVGGSPSSAPSVAPTNGPDLRPLAGKVIVIDPGHNGGDPRHTAAIASPVPMGTGMKQCETTGTETNSGYQESAFTFDVATRLAALARAAGATVVMTRTDNSGYGPCVNRRAAIGNEHHADAAVSIHGDGAPARDHGFHVLQPARVGAPSNAIIDVSHRLALAIRDGYRKWTGIPPANYIGTDGINTRGDMGGLNLSTVPKVMIECGNMRNSSDAAKMTDPAYRQRMALGIAAGLATFLAG